jgi:hypothetical protein
MDRQLAAERDVLGVTALDVRPELREALPQQPGVVVELGGAVDEVGRIEVHGELPAVDRAHELQVAVGRIGERPRHRLEREERPPRLDRVDDLPHRVDDQGERVAAEVVGMRPVPGVAAGAGEGHAAARPDAVGEREPALAELQRRRRACARRG